jgi:hypothetical protein
MRNERKRNYFGLRKSSISRSVAIMTFSDWVKERGFDWVRAGEAISCSASEAWHYANGTRIPRRDKVIEIFRRTDGQVSPLDWYGLTAADLPEQSASRDAA